MLFFWSPYSGSLLGAFDGTCRIVIRMLSRICSAYANIEVLLKDRQVSFAI